MSTQLLKSMDWRGKKLQEITRGGFQSHAGTPQSSMFVGFFPLWTIHELGYPNLWKPHFFTQICDFHASILGMGTHRLVFIEKRVPHPMDDHPDVVKSRGGRTSSYNVKKYQTISICIIMYRISFVCLSVCLSMDGCMYVCMHVCMYVWLCIYSMHVNAYVCIYLWMHL